MDIGPPTRVRLSRLLGIPLLLVALLTSAGYAHPLPRVARDTALPALFPPDNIWNRTVTDLPVHPNSAAYLRVIGLDSPLHADVGAGTWQGEQLGIAYTVVPGSQPLVPVHYTAYGDQSDPGPMPIPPDAPVGGGPDSARDRHVIVLDNDHRMLYELYKAYPNPDGSWEARSGARWSLDSNALRPDGWTSADAAGLPMLPGEIRYDEVQTGRIAHALRFTGLAIAPTYVWPARHSDGTSSDPSAPPMGLRLRLKSSVDISGFPFVDRVILQALKDYGMILADTADELMLCGINDDRWSNAELGLLRSLRGADFEAVDVSGVMVAPDSGQARQPLATGRAGMLSRAAAGGTGARWRHQEAVVPARRRAGRIARRSGVRRPT